MSKKIRYFLEALALKALMLVFKLLPLDTASNLGGRMGRLIGPKLGASKKALNNINKAIPNQENPKEVIAGMWENLGRVIAEYPHLERISKERVSFKGQEYLVNAKKENKAIMLISAHIANWEITGLSILHHLNISASPVYRAPNNIYVEDLLLNARTAKGKIKAFPKSKSGTRELLKAMKEKQTVGILIDQKYNEGVSVPFFGCPAMTSPAFVDLPQKYDGTLIPVHVERINGANFKISFLPPIALFDENKEPLNRLEIIQNAHALLESWIIRRPEQWLWLHRRWSDKAIKEYKKAA
jgi:KDO2-lipid IV(A) lauroyltransferase